MSRNKKYPFVLPPVRCESWSRPGIKSCSKCHLPFKRKERIVVVETQVNWFRGDDEVVAYHDQCYSPHAS